MPTPQQSRLTLPATSTGSRTPEMVAVERALNGLPFFETTYVQDWDPSPPLFTYASAFNTFGEVLFTKKHDWTWLKFTWSVCAQITAGSVTFLNLDVQMPIRNPDDSMARLCEVGRYYMNLQSLEMSGESLDQFKFDTPLPSGQYKFTPRILGINFNHPSGTIIFPGTWHFSVTEVARRSNG